MITQIEEKFNLSMSVSSIVNHKELLLQRGVNNSRYEGRLFEIAYGPWSNYSEILTTEEGIEVCTPMTEYNSIQLGRAIALRPFHGISTGDIRVSLTDRFMEIKTLGVRRYRRLRIQDSSTYTRWNVTRVVNGVEETHPMMVRGARVTRPRDAVETINKWAFLAMLLDDSVDMTVNIQQYAVFADLVAKGFVAELSYLSGGMSRVNQLRSRS